MSCARALLIATDSVNSLPLTPIATGREMFKRPRKSNGVRICVDRFLEMVLYQSSETDFKRQRENKSPGCIH